MLSSPLAGNPIGTSVLLRGESVSSCPSNPCLSSYCIILYARNSDPICQLGYPIFSCPPSTSILDRAVVEMSLVKQLLPFFTGSHRLAVPPLECHSLGNNSPHWGFCFFRLHPRECRRGCLFSSLRNHPVLPGESVNEQESTSSNSSQVNWVGFP